MSPNPLYSVGKGIPISPKGEVLGEIALPMRNVTCVAFVDTELFIITTTKDEVNDEQLSKLSRVHVGIRGNPSTSSGSVTAYLVDKEDCTCAGSDTLVWVLFPNTSPPSHQTFASESQTGSVAQQSRIQRHYLQSPF